MNLKPSRRWRCKDKGVLSEWGKAMVWTRSCAYESNVEERQSRRKTRSWLVLQAGRAVKVAGLRTQGNRWQCSASYNVGSRGKNLTVEMNDTQHGRSRSTRVLYIIYSKYFLYRLIAIACIKWDGGETVFSRILWLAIIEQALDTQNPRLDWQKS